MSDFCDRHGPNFARDTKIAILGAAFASIFLTVVLFNAGMIFNYFNSWLGLIEFTASALLLVNVYLLAKQKLINYWFGLAGVLLFGYLFKEYNLLSDMYLQWAFYAPLQIVGFVMWKWGPTIWDWVGNKFGDVKATLSPTDSMKIKVLDYKARALWVVLFVAAMAWWVPKMVAAGADFAVADATIMWLSIIASIIMLRKYLENWLLWITVDIIAIPVYWQKELYVTSGLYVIFLCLATYGLVSWYREWKEDRAAAVAGIKRRWDAENSTSSDGTIVPHNAGYASW